MFKIQVVADFNKGTLEGLGVRLVADNADGEVLLEDFEEKLDKHLSIIRSQVLYHRKVAMKVNSGDSKSFVPHPLAE